MGLFARLSLVMFWVATPALAQAPNPASKPSAPVASDRDALKSLLAEFRAYPEFFEGILPEKEKSFSDVDPRLVDALAPKVLESRVTEFVAPYLALRRRYEGRAKTLADLEARLKKTPISDLQNRPKLELAVQAVRSEHKPLRRNLFLLSLDANVSMRKAIDTLTAAQKSAALGASAPPSTALSAADPKGETATAAPTKIPKLPGVFGRTREARLKEKDADRGSLTPVDDEFYATALGKKLETDLGGRAEAWSYDYGKNELYVSVDGKVGKIRVKQEGAGVRFIQTRVGQDFVEPKGKDQRVELGAKGRFLTGEKSDQTLFGEIPKATPRVADELPPGHSKNDGHDHGGHDHKH